MRRERAYLKGLGDVAFSSHSGPTGPLMRGYAPDPGLDKVERRGSYRSAVIGGREFLDQTRSFAIGGALAPCVFYDEAGAARSLAATEWNPGHGGNKPMRPNGPIYGETVERTRHRST